MRRLCFAILIICACNCSQTKHVWKTIDMGEYLIDVPEYFKLTIEKGIDSQPGLLKGKDINLQDDYGPYGDTLVMTTQEYVRKGRWKDDAIIRFLNTRIHPDVDWVKTEVTAIRPCVKSDSSFAAGCDLVASCIYKNDKFILPIYIPQEIKDHIVKIDTIQQYYRRLVYLREGRKGIIGVYMRKAKINPGILYNSMVIGARNLNDKQQALVMQILATLRPKSTQ